ncbi:MULTISPECIES: heme ABC transporter ATP-binding protein [Pseudoalteromonas]|uniref:Heme ABC transporter ATP-binding protein n=1 Tax=Pseudoalteromonas obscura TaxID=3048491 RepID=A0ABT7EHJ8_9GAMM|nr:MULTISPECIES: heme ABC transporter ATP-binding protein [Pseudoalteromonas]MBQ4836171.1 heme ABC transporter ATP-binding protein [Pseudoalteromonas luteoviolacea]MDK2594520.1 heme ABC transporter ATP-binding protein [Pseudoalteromonas sp. P94(2023)]
MLECKNISITRGTKRIIHDLSFTAHQGEFIVLLGENGAGKSTLLSAICDDLYYSGEVLLNEQSIHVLDPQTLATQRAMLLQNNRVNFAFSAAELIAMGRYPYHETAQAQADVVNDIITQMSLEALADRDVTVLSGGEFQRVQFARCIAQLNAHNTQTTGKLMLLDEPTSALDLHHQHVTLSKAKSFAEQGNTVIAVLHDLNLASLYADRILLLHHGIIYHDGKPQDVLRPEVLQPIYRAGMQINLHPSFEIPMIFSEPLTGASNA